MVKIILTENEGNQRLDRFLKKYFQDAPLSYIYKTIRKDLKVNGKRAKEDTMLLEGDELSFFIPDDEFAKLTKKKSRVSHAKKQFKVVYEDDNVLICEKPYGLLTHGDKTEKKNHLANQVIDYLIETGSYNPRLERTFTPAPVNRLDRNTTGLVLFGKNAKALQDLNKMIRNKDDISKRYMTIVHGKIEHEMILRDKMLKDERRNLVSVIDESSEDGKLMETVARPLKVGKYHEKWYTLLEVEIITGRTHQIRAHLAKEGYPVIGDIKYGARKEFGLSTQLLHSHMLVFNRCEESLKYLEGKSFTAELPDDFLRIENTIFKNSGDR